MKERCAWAFRLANIAAKRVPRKSNAASRLVEWGHKAYLALEEENSFDPPWLEESIADEQTASWGAFKAYLESQANHRSTVTENARHSVDQFCRSIGCSETETRIIELALGYCVDPDAERVTDIMANELDLSMIELVSLFTDEPRINVERALSHGSVISQSGILERTSERKHVHFSMPARLVDALMQSSGCADEMAEALFGAQTQTDLSMEDFDHIEADRDLALKILRGALADKAHGVNILLYGAPGVGKSELCAVFANRLGAKLRSVAQSNEDHEDPARGERLREYRLAQRLLPRDQGNLVLFDELEDLTSDGGLSGMLLGRRAKSGSKVFLNRLLETNPVPTLWTSNDINGIDPALLRRMTMVMEIPRPPVKARAKIWASVSREAGIDASPEEITRLARRYDAAPGLIATAAKGAMLAGESVEAIDRLLTKSVELQGAKPRSDTQDELIDLSLFHADEDLELLAQRLCAAGPGAFSLCLYGAPGTGKSAYARKLADMMGLPVMERRASDILGMFVGESEKNIAEAFKDAEREKAFLVFDEADSLLASRAGAQRRWEVSQVNEMLTCMERHPMPFACTTNLIETLDPASARRFTFKIEFKTLTRSQISAAFELYFGKPAPARLLAKGAPSLGDFAVVKKKATLLGINSEPDIAEMLVMEQAHRGKPVNEIGFAIKGAA